MPSIAMETARAAQTRRAPAGVASPAGVGGGVSVWGRWRLGACLGRGAVAEVHAAWPVDGAESATAPYAIKRLLPHLSGEPLALATLCREAQVGAVVCHPHIVPVLAADLSGDLPWLLMPRYHGATLERRIAPGGLPLGEALWIARQAADALAALHAAGWVHGDLKAGNLLLQDNGHLTLIDLGFAARIGSPTTLAERPALGTPLTLAPEMFRATTIAAPQSDLYSLGVMLFQMVTGSAPYSGGSMAELARAHAEEAVPDLRRGRTTAGVSLSRLVRQLLAKTPQRRPDSAAAVSALLRRMELEHFGDYDAEGDAA